MALDPTRTDDSLELPPGTRIGAVVSSFHRDLTGAMLESARDEFLRSGLAPDDLIEVWVPGSFELPLVARRMARRSDVDAVLCLGLVLRGETPHDVYIAHAVSQGILRVSLEVDKPVLFGVLTCNTLDQARSRALSVEAGGREDKGREVAAAAVRVLAALREAGAEGDRETAR